MYEQLVTTIQSSDISGIITQNVDTLLASLNNYLSGADNLRMASIVLMILAAVMLLLLVIIVYVKSIIVFLRNNNQDDVSSDDTSDDEALESIKSLNNQERELELEKELQKELELARAERESSEKDKKKKQKEKQEQKKEKEREKEDKDREKKEKESQEQKKYSYNSPNRENLVDLDWKKGKLPDQYLSTDINQGSLHNLSYHQSNKQLNELTGLIIDMIGRGVDDLKIAQTIMFRNHYMSSEEDVLQLIDSVKGFIGMCRNQDFKYLESTSLPSEEDALYHLAEGDPTPALALIENLMDYNIDRAASGPENKKDELYRNISEQAVIFGNLAAVNDVHLATGAFELAIELEPQNISAWSRLGDMYAKAETSNRAVWAYQNVLNMADGDINPREVANASKNMSQHMYAQGNSLQAAKLYNNSKQFYDSLGINRRLDKQEIEIVEIIETNHQDEIRLTIQNLLGRAA